MNNFANIQLRGRNLDSQCADALKVAQNDNIISFGFSPSSSRLTWISYDSSNSQYKLNSLENYDKGYSVPKQIDLEYQANAVQISEDGSYILVPEYYGENNYLYEFFSLLQYNNHNINDQSENTGEDIAEGENKDENLNLILLNAKFDDDNKYIVNSLSNSNFQIQQTMSEQIIGEIEGNGVQNVKFTVRNDKILGQYSQNNPAIWNMDSLDQNFSDDLERIVLKDEEEVIQIINSDFSKNKKWAATAGKNGIIYIWDAKTGQKIDKLEGHNKNQVLEVKFSNDSSKLVSYDQNENMIIWYLDDSGQANYYYLYENMDINNNEMNLGSNLYFNSYNSQILYLNQEGKINSMEISNCQGKKYTLVVSGDNSEKNENENSSDEDDKEKESTSAGQQILFYLQIAAYVIAGSLVLCLIMNLISKYRKRKREEKLKKQKEAEKSSRYMGGDSTFRSGQQNQNSVRSYGKGPGVIRYSGSNPPTIKDFSEINPTSSNQTNYTSQNHTRSNSGMNISLQLSKKQNFFLVGEGQNVPQIISNNIFKKSSVSQQNGYLGNFKSSQEFLQVYDIEEINFENLINKDELRDEQIQQQINEQRIQFGKSFQLLSNLKEFGNNSFLMENSQTKELDLVKVYLTKNREKFTIAKSQIEKEYIYSQTTQYKVQRIKDLYFWFSDGVYIIIAAKEFDENIQTQETIFQWINKNKHLHKTFSLSSCGSNQFQNQYTKNIFKQIIQILNKLERKDLFFNIKPNNFFIRDNKVDMATDLYFSKFLLRDQLCDEDLKYFSPKIQYELSCKDMSQISLKEVLSKYTPQDLVYSLGVMFLEIQEEKYFSYQEIEETFEHLEILNKQGSDVEGSPQINLIFQMLNPEEDMRIKSISDVYQKLLIM